ETTFCAEIAESYYTGLTNGTTPTTFSTSPSVTREQMAAFITRTLDATLKRASRQAALQQFWKTAPQYPTGLGAVTVGEFRTHPQSDGSDVWVPTGDGTVSRVRGSDGAVLETWTGATAANGVVVAMGRILASGLTAPGKLYMIDPSQTAGAV